ncbi:MAG: type II secretion system protein [Armatimonadota bacterium]|nr:MAG: type II secretion system protein [Armatimonadota bacterium]
MGSTVRRRRGCPAGFTLVEMLVVVAILIALMAIIVPSYQVLAAQNRRATCAANLKAIGQALALFREDYQCFPPDATEFLVMPSNPDDPEQNPGDPVTAMYNSAGYPVETGVRGLGLYTLYYLGAYSAVLPPYSVEPRIGNDLRTQLSAERQGLNGLLWFRGAGYIDELSTFHCPANDTELNEGGLGIRGQLPYLGGWNNYDMYYRRNFWNPGTRLLPPRYQDDSGQDVYDSRHLMQAYPPADTVVTWCPYHRKSSVPAFPGVAATPVAGDQDIVLFADGSVRRMTTQASNKMYEEPTPGAGWPQGPIL